MSCRSRDEVELLVAALRTVDGIVKAEIIDDNKNDLYIALYCEQGTDEIRLGSMLPQGWQHWPWNTENRYYKTSMVSKD
ncbi:MAG: hypothetical protein WCT04_00210 [Planctomycetota bacterium]